MNHPRSAGFSLLSDGLRTPVGIGGESVSPRVGPEFPHTSVPPKLSPESPSGQRRKEDSGLSIRE